LGSFSLLFRWETAVALPVQLVPTWYPKVPGAASWNITACPG